MHYLNSNGIQVKKRSGFRTEWSTNKAKQRLTHDTVHALCGKSQVIRTFM